MKGLLFLRYERMKNMAKSYEMDMCNGPILGKVLTYSIPPVSYTHLDVYKRQFVSFLYPFAGVTVAVEYDAAVITQHFL